MLAEVRWYRRVRNPVRHAYDTVHHDLSYLLDVIFGDLSDKEQCAYTLRPETNCSRVTRYCLSLSKERNKSTGRMFLSVMNWISNFSGSHLRTVNKSGGLCTHLRPNSSNATSSTRVTFFSTSTHSSVWMVVCQIQSARQLVDP